MRRLIITLVIFLLLFTGCHVPQEENVSVPKDGETVFKLNSVRTYRENGQYIVAICNGGSQTEYVAFDTSRKCVSEDTVGMLEKRDYSSHLGTSFTAFQELYGSPHTDVGSGFYIPAYVVDEGYLLEISEENDIIIRLSMIDILNNEVVMEQKSQ